MAAKAQAAEAQATQAQAAEARAAAETGAAAGAKPDLSGPPFEQALAELEEIVKRLERGDVPLDESIVIYERGERLKAHCEALLKRAEARIETITTGADGKPTGTRPLDVE